MFKQRSSHKLSVISPFHCVAVSCLNLLLLYFITWATSPVHHCYLEPVSLLLQNVSFMCSVLIVDTEGVRTIQFTKTHNGSVVLDADLLLVCCQREQHNDVR